MSNPKFYSNVETNNTPNLGCVCAHTKVYLVLVNGVSLFLVLQSGTEFSLALIHPGHKVVTAQKRMQRDDQGGPKPLSSLVVFNSEIEQFTYLKATLRDRGPWYLELMAKAFSRKRSERSYSITPWSTRPILLCKRERTQTGALVQYYISNVQCIKSCETRKKQKHGEHVKIWTTDPKSHPKNG